MAGNPGADRDWGRHQDQVRVLLIYVKSNEKSLGSLNLLTVACENDTMQSQSWKESITTINMILIVVIDS